jgi:hypothetical protein
MSTPEERTLKNSNPTINSADKLQAAIDPTGGVKTIEPPMGIERVEEKQEAALDPTGGVKRVDLF